VSRSRAVRRAGKEQAVWEATTAAAMAVVVKPSNASCTTARHLESATHRIRRKKSCWSLVEGLSTCSTSSASSPRGGVRPHRTPVTGPVSSDGLTLLRHPQDASYLRLGVGALLQGCGRVLAHFIQGFTRCDLHLPQLAVFVWLRAHRVRGRDQQGKMTLYVLYGRTASPSRVTPCCTKHQS